MSGLALPLCAELIHFDILMIFAHKIITGSGPSFLTIFYTNNRKTILR